MNHNRIGLLLLAIFLNACATKLPAKTPIGTLFFNAGEHPSSTLIVLLPGVADRPETFQQEGFINALRDRKINADLVAVDAHLGYYRERNMVERLHQDVILPAQTKGYRDIWLVGISLGGWGSILYAQQHQHDISGLLLLAPFIADRKLFDEVQAAGGLDAWRLAHVDPQDDQRAGLAWLADFKQTQAPLKLYLGYGASDRFATPIGLLGARLPAEQVSVVRGGHDWPTWLKLWNGFLDRHTLR